MLKEGAKATGDEGDSEIGRQIKLLSRKLTRDQGRSNPASAGAGAGAGAASSVSENGGKVRAGRCSKAL